MSAHQPLAGIRVVELGTSVAAPYGTWILATLGAEVIKIERPDGGERRRRLTKQDPEADSQVLNDPHATTP